MRSGAGLSLFYAAIVSARLVNSTAQFWNWGIAKRGAAEASSFAMLVPIIAGILSAIVFSESFGAAKVIGGALAMAGLVAIRIDRKPKPG